MGHHIPPDKMRNFTLLTTERNGRTLIHPSRVLAKSQMERL